MEVKQFNPGIWIDAINVRDFVIKNVTPYHGTHDFLVGPSAKTQKLWDICKAATQEERANNGIRSLDTETISTVSAFNAGYIDKANEVIVGLQTDELLKRTMKPFGGFKVVQKALAEQGVKPNDNLTELFSKYVKTHNDGVFSAYNAEIKKFRSLGFLTGLPDNYARGRVIGDYRRIALYGINFLIEEKKKDKANIVGPMTEAVIRLREEVADQINALQEMIALGAKYDLDLTRPAENAKEAVQWTYMAYLAAVKEQDGAAMSLGNVSTFLDIYIENDLQDGLINEEEAQVTKTSFRFLNTLYNLGPSPEPNMTILWSEKLPQNFKDYCAKVAIDSSSIQFENDEMMRTNRGSDDYGIACCVSYQALGKSIQFFGARTNLAKTLLLAINGGCCEITGTQMVKGIEPCNCEYLDFDKVMSNFKIAMKEVARVYNDSMNIIHYMHDKYYYEKAQMALIDTNPSINIAYGIAGLSIVADSLSAIKYAKVKPIRNEDGLTVDFKIEGEFPCYGNDDDRVDALAAKAVKDFNDELKKLPVYKNAEPTMSVLTITSNVVYGKKTGATPDGRAKGIPFAPGANPMHGRDSHGAIASLNSVAKIDYEDSQDGISNTFSIVPKSLGANDGERIENLATILDGYFSRNAQHVNVNVLDKDTLLDAMEHPEAYPQLTIRVSGYAVNFVRLTREQQMEVITRSFHESI